jgi:hypothetical protein
MGLYHLYFNQTLFSHGNFTETELQRQTGYSTSASTDYVSPENRRAAQFAREDFRGLTMADVERQAAQMPWGTAAEVTERIIEAAGSADVHGTDQAVCPRGAPSFCRLTKSRIFRSQKRFYLIGELSAAGAHHRRESLHCRSASDTPISPYRSCTLGR